MIIYVLIVVVIIPILWAVITYNRLISLRAHLKNAWAGIDVQLKRRYDLIPNLVETAKGYLKHEREVLENVIKARSQAISASGVQDQAKAENFLTQTLKSLFAVVENYPDLKANQNMLTLHEELTSTENRVSFARNHYNDWTAKLNIAIQRFPNRIIANLFNFKKAEFFEIEDVSVRRAPEVKF